VTKAVGDVLGVRGIAEEAIRFNGYPFLEKDDHVYDAPVSRVMRRDIYTLRATGMTVADVERYVDASKVKGFPIVVDDETRTLAGYVRSQVLRSAIDRAKQVVDLQADTLCAFSPDPAEQPDARWSAICGDEDMESNVRYAVATPGILKLWPWVNQTPLTVSPKLPLEVVMQVFKRMGPRVILVEDLGTLVGLTSVKDVLHLEPHEQLNSPMVAWGNWGALDGALEEIWTWLAGVRSSINAWYGRASRRWR